MKTHQALSSRGIVFGNSLIAAPLTRNQEIAFSKMEFLIGEMTMWEVTGDNTIFRTARKTHRCYGGHDGTKNTKCDTPIKAGDQYVEYVGEVPCWQSGYRYHHVCAEQQGLVRRVDRTAKP